MAFRRFARGRSSFRRAKIARRGAWDGKLVLQYSMSAGTVYGWYLWDDLASQELNVAGKCVHQRTVYWLSVTPNSGGSPNHTAWYISAEKTDAAGIVPTAMLMDPIPTTAAAMPFYRKDLMEYQFRDHWGPSNVTVTSYPSGINANTHFGDIRVKRRLDDTDALMFVIKSSGAALLTLGHRTYMSW